jgi:putative spermidine/putrescine transport system ATP-binding protein
MNGTGRLEIEGLTKRYDATLAVDAVDLSIAPGMFVALLGPSGCGKTTLLRCVAGLVRADAGDLRVDGRSIAAIPPWRRELGMVFQSYALFPHMTVAKNVAFGLKMRGLGGAEIAGRVEQALAQVQMAGFETRLPAQLSGGQQQRVALARALVTEPKVLLLDEPLSALDAKLRQAMRLELRQLQRRLGITTIFVTHDQEEALTMADHVAVMNRGRVEQLDSPEGLYHRPATPFVADFIGETNRFDGTVGDAGLHVLGLPAPVALADSRVPGGTALIAMIRPERIRPTAPGAGRLDGQVAEVIFGGERTSLLVDSGAHRLIVRQPADAAAISVGARVGLDWRAEDLLVYPA